jgi:hypothetical protein
MALEDAEKYAHCMINLTNQARGVVRDLNPKVLYIKELAFIIIFTTLYHIKRIINRTN